MKKTILLIFVTLSLNCSSNDTTSLNTDFGASIIGDWLALNCDGTNPTNFDRPPISYFADGTGYTRLIQGENDPGIEVTFSWTIEDNILSQIFLTIDGDPIDSEISEYRISFESNDKFRIEDANPDDDLDLTTACLFRHDDN